MEADLEEEEPATEAMRVTECSDERRGAMVMMRRSEDGGRCVRATERAALARGERSMCSAFCTLI